MIRSLALATGLACAAAVAWHMESRSADVITTTDVDRALAHRARPEAWLEKTKREALARTGQSGDCCEWDHRIPRCMGGADDLSNLWLQPCSEWRVLSNGIRICSAGPAYDKDKEEAEWCRRIRKVHTVRLLQAGQQHFREWRE